MTDRLLQRLLLATAISGTTALVVALSSAGSSVVPRTGPSVATATTPVAIAHEPIMLPTVVVRPEAVVPTLATVTVRASIADRVAADLAAEDAAGLLTSAGGGLALYPLPSAAFDMPYYSFGRTLRRVNKE